MLKETDRHEAVRGVKTHRAYMRGHESAQQTHPASMRGWFSAGKCAPHICEVYFQLESAPRIYARPIFAPKVHPAYMRGENAEMK